MSWNVVLKLNYLTIFCCIAFFINYFSLRFPNEKEKKVVNIVIASSLICIVFAIVAGPLIFTILTYTLYFLLLVTFSYFFVPDYKRINNEK